MKSGKQRKKNRRRTGFDSCLTSVLGNYREAIYNNLFGAPESKRTRRKISRGWMKPRSNSFLWKLGLLSPGDEGKGSSVSFGT